MTHHNLASLLPDLRNMLIYLAPALELLRDLRTQLQQRVLPVYICVAHLLLLPLG